MSLKSTLVFVFMLMMVNCKHPVEPTPTPTTPNTPTASPTAKILCNNQDSCNIAYGANPQITWASSYTASCAVSGTTWTGTSGSQSAGPLTTSREYELKCIGTNGASVTSVVKVTVAAQQPPEAFTLSGKCTTVNDSTQKVDLTWTPSANATSYAVERRIWSTGAWTRQGSGPGTTYTEVVPNNVDCYWRAVGINALGEKISTPAELLVCANLIIIPGGPGKPEINMTSVPPKGSTANLRGNILHVLPSDHKVSCWIYVNGGWWPKPTFANILTSIQRDGSWECDVTTGGVDEQATELRTYLVTNSYVQTSFFGLPSVNGRDVLAVAIAKR
jgi:hypothetical protein